VAGSSGRTSGPSLPAALKLPALTAYAIGDILGAGIYALVGKVAAVCGPGLWVAFIASAVVALLTGLAYAEFGSRYPRSAGAALYCRRGFGHPLPAFGVSVLAQTTSFLLMIVFLAVHVSLLLVKWREPVPPAGVFTVPRIIPLAGAASCLWMLFQYPPPTYMFGLGWRRLRRRFSIASQVAPQRGAERPEADTSAVRQDRLGWRVASIFAAFSYSWSDSSRRRPSTISCVVVNVTPSRSQCAVQRSAAFWSIARAASSTKSTRRTQPVSPRIAWCTHTSSATP